jgi:hypothetical protein
MGFLVSHSVLFCDSLVDDMSDDLPPPNHELAARYAEMTDQELLDVVRLMCASTKTMH